MKLQCDSPELQMLLLDGLRSGDDLDEDLAAHYGECDDCRTAVERFQRIRQAWAEQQDGELEDEHALAVAASRFQVATGRRKLEIPGPLFFGFAGAMAALLVLLVTQRVPARPGAASVAAQPTGAAASIASARENILPAVAAPAERSLAVVPQVRGPHGAVPLSEGLRIDLKEGETAHVELGDGRTSELRGPAAFEVRASSSEVSGWRLSPIAAARADAVIADPDERAAHAFENGASPSPKGAEPERAIVVEKSANPKITRAWARAADALRENDFADADRAFDELCRAPDAPTRDAARLARAQLWIANGRGAEVRPVLVDLAATGATALVRQRAAELLSRPQH
jgi:hypothetical protein